MHLMQMTIPGFQSLSWMPPWDDTLRIRGQGEGALHVRGQTEVASLQRLPSKKNLLLCGPWGPSEPI